MLRAVPATIDIADSIPAAFKSGILTSAICLTCSLVIEPIFSRFGSPEPFLEPTASNIKVEVEATPIIIEGESIPIIISQKTYYIIAGAFAEQKNANKMLRKLNSWNYNAEIVEGSNLLRVSYNSFYNRDKAVLALNKIKQENPEAWLLTK